MSPARDFLRRFRPANAPGRAAAASVPADRAADLATELEPVLLMLADAEAERARILSEAEPRRRQIRARARREARRRRCRRETVRAVRACPRRRGRAGAEPAPMPKPPSAPPSMRRRRSESVRSGGCLATSPGWYTRYKHWPAMTLGLQMPCGPVMRQGGRHERPVGGRLRPCKGARPAAPRKRRRPPDRQQRIAARGAYPTGAQPLWSRRPARAVPDGSAAYGRPYAAMEPAGTGRLAAGPGRRIAADAGGVVRDRQYRRIAPRPLRWRRRSHVRAWRAGHGLAAAANRRDPPPSSAPPWPPRRGRTRAGRIR